MSIVTAYRCDFRGHLVTEKKAVGILLVEDLYDKEKSYPTVMNPAKAICHYCLDCYKKEVLTVAERQVQRSKRNEDEYKLKLRELSYDLRITTVKKWRLLKKS